ncbi:MAG: VCBS repeat-containing protein [Saprospiraceae bacterium]
MMRLLQPEETGVSFTNTLYESTELNIITFEYLYNGAGVAVGDINDDGLADLYFSGNMVPGRLYLNRGDLHFEEVTEQAGIDTRGKWGTGVSMVDVNADGRLDLYLCFSGPYTAEVRKNMLYINNGDGTFTEQAAAFGLDDTAHTTQAAFFDYDKDGDLDVYLLNNMTDETGPNIIRPKRLNGEMLNTDKLYRNDNGHFTDVSRQAGILKEGYGLGVAIGDIDQDGWPDIYVSNDYLSNDLLYINNGDGTFTDRAAEYFRHTSYSSMGCDLADYNNDGLPDIVAVDMLPPDNKRRKLMMGSVNYNRFRSEILTGYFPQYMRNTLQWNRGKVPDGKVAFSEIGQLAGIAGTDWSWSPLLADMDNDGWKDLLITNGYPRDITNLDFAAYKANLMMQSQYNTATLQQLIQAVNEVEGAYLPNYCFRNQGDLTFSDASAVWGFTQPSFSHGAAIADLDNDGDLDYVTNNSFDPVFIYENRSRQLQPEHHFLRLQLSGHSIGFGTKVWLYRDTSVQFQEYYPVRGFQSSVEHTLHFGLGEQAIVDSVRIQWPDDAWQVIPQPSVDQVLNVDYAPNTHGLLDTTEAQATLLRAIPAPDFQHQDPHFSDFKVQPLLMHKYSQEGPSISMADVNGDGLDDLFIGGAFRQSGKIMIQCTDASFRTYELDAALADREDLGSLFFDADQDGDTDLYVTSGSSEFPANSQYYQDRLYLNDGTGRFALAPEALPTMNSSTSCVAAADYDLDGDLDLFVGGFVHLDQYPTAPRSFLLENKGGKFEDVTARLAPELIQPGLIKDAVWTDLNMDGRADLVLAGEWLPISVFLNTDGRLENQTIAAGLGSTVGWWNRLAVHDLDQDGDPDLIGTNAGWNTPFHSDPQAALSLYRDDLDGDGRLDPLIGYYLQDKQVPVQLRNDVLSWMPSLKKRFTNYEQYALTGWKDLLADKVSPQLPANWFATSWFENMGDGTFSVHALPREAQLTSFYGILADDLNGDLHPDLLLVGNSSAPNPDMGQFDAANGLLLLGDGQGHFQPQSMQESGFYVPGEGRDLIELRTAQGNKTILAARNNAGMLEFQIQLPKQ